MKPLLLVAVVAALAHGQTFEVVSIKPAPPPDPGAGMRVSSRGGPGSKDPGMWTCENMSLSNLVSNAFDLHAHQLNAPSWMDQQRFNVTARIAEGATREQFRQMMQNMLIERFGFKFHREKKEIQGYELVLGKNGPKFREAVPETPPDPSAQADGARPRPGPPIGPKLGPDGYPVLGPGGTSMAIMRDRARAQWMGVTMENFAANIAYQAGKPVVDGTGLAGKFDLYLFWMPQSMSAAAPGSGKEEATPVASDPAGPDLFKALQEQLGLKLEPKKVSIDVLVVDHAEKTSTDN